MNTAICVTPFVDMRLTMPNNKIVIKLGGGLITDKSQYKLVREEKIKSVCKVISKLIKNDESVILVHGAGSFGHLEAKKWHLSTGHNIEIIEQQRLAVKNVRNDMIELNNYVVKYLKEYGIDGISHPPSKWANGLGPQFNGDISKLGYKRKDTCLLYTSDAADE